MKPIIWPYKLGSASARLLAAALETKRVRSNGTYQPRSKHLIINWGNVRIPNWWSRLTVFNLGGPVLNSPVTVAVARNKRYTFQTLNGRVVIPRWTTDKTEAVSWIQDGKKVFCRTTLTGMGGSGIITATTEDELVDAPLYTLNVGKRTEYRVHVFNGEVIDFIQKKKLTQEQLDERGIIVNYTIRNHNNGWVFAREGVELPETVREQALLAVTTLGLDFGAVDCYVTERDGTAGVFEVNTAPGIEGTTLERYVNAIRSTCAS